MDDPLPHRVEIDENGPRAEREPMAPMPRWVKVFGSIVIVVMTLFVILMLTRGHGPGRHMGSGDPAGQAPQDTGSR